MLAILMNRRGYKTAILDADVTGPSIPKAFGIKEKATVNEFGLLPVKSKTGIEIMSTNLLLENETDLWFGEVLFCLTLLNSLSEVIWNDVDYMFVDMPLGQEMYL